MTYKSYPLFVFGFHGCDRSVAEKVLAGDAELQPSDNGYDWLGTGIYFWENAPERALEWACAQNKKEPYVVGAIIQLSSCLNLMDTESTSVLNDTYQRLLVPGMTLPENKSKKHNLDMFVINAATEFAEKRGRYFDAVRGAFIEGNEIFPHSSIRSDTHIQLCVRNPECILAYFRPKRLDFKR